MNDNQAFNLIVIALIVLYYIGIYNTVAENTFKKEVEKYNHNVVLKKYTGTNLIKI